MLKCETVFKLSAEVMRRRGRPGPLRDGAARYSTPWRGCRKIPPAFSTGEERRSTGKTRADSTLESDNHVQTAQNTAREGSNEEFSRKG